MFHLAIECSGFQASVALCFQDQLVIERRLGGKQGTLEALAPAIEGLVRAVSPALISITAGPGSFTGLRIGLTTAKMLAFAWDIPVAPIDTLEVIAEQQRRLLQTRHRQEQQSSQIVVAAIDAFRNQVFAAAWQWQSTGSWLRVGHSQVADAATWTHNPLRALDASLLRTTARQAEAVVLTGTALERYPPASEFVDDDTGRRLNAVLAPPDEWTPRVDIVAELGWRVFTADQAVGADELLPNYLRGSAAEEKSRRS